MPGLGSVLNLRYASRNLCEIPESRSVIQGNSRIKHPRRTGHKGCDSMITGLKVSMGYNTGKHFVS